MQNLRVKIKAAYLNLTLVPMCLCDKCLGTENTNMLMIDCNYNFLEQATFVIKTIKKYIVVF